MHNSVFLYLYDPDTIASFSCLNGIINNSNMRLRLFYVFRFISGEREKLIKSRVAVRWNLTVASQAQWLYYR